MKFYLLPIDDGRGLLIPNTMLKVADESVRKQMKSIKVINVRRQPQTMDRTSKVCGVNLLVKFSHTSASLIAQVFAQHV